MTYEQYLARSRTLQLGYIADELSRMATASTLLDAADSDHTSRAYKLAMGRINLHPLTRSEIDARVVELHGMRDRVDETHGDTPGQRAIFKSKLWQKSDGSPRL